MVPAKRPFAPQRLPLHARRALADTIRDSLQTVRDEPEEAVRRVTTSGDPDAIGDLLRDLAAEAELQTALRSATRHAQPGAPMGEERADMEQCVAALVAIQETAAAVAGAFQHYLAAAYGVVNTHC